MKRHSFCPVCGDEGLHEMKTTILREFEGFKKEVPFHASVCGSCGSETLTDQQAKFNKRQMTDFYRAANGLLTGSQIKAIRDDLHLTQSEAASIFGGGKNAFTKYENGDVTQSLALDKLIRTCYAVPAALKFLREDCPSVINTEIYTIHAQSEIFNTYPISKVRRSPLTRRCSKNSATVILNKYEVDFSGHQYVTVGSQL